MVPSAGDRGAFEGRAGWCPPGPAQQSAGAPGPAGRAPPRVPGASLGRPPGRRAGSGNDGRNGTYAWTCVTSWVAPGTGGRRRPSPVDGATDRRGRSKRKCPVRANAGGVGGKQRSRGDPGPIGKSRTDSWGLKGRWSGAAAPCLCKRTGLVKAIRNPGPAWAGGMA